MNNFRPGNHKTKQKDMIMKYKVSCAMKPGFNKISSIGDGELKLTEFAVINLADKQRFAANSGGFEVALVVLGGKCAVKGDGFEFASVGERPDVFSGRPHTVYIPCNTAYEIIALGRGHARRQSFHVQDRRLRHHT